MSQATGLPIALLGLRCVGKTTVGRALGAALGVPAIDLDARVAERAGFADAAGLIRERGLPAFRAAEETELREVLRHAGPGGVGSGVRGGASTPGFVLSTGGGVVESVRAREVIRGAAYGVWLKAPVELLAERLRKDGGEASRPSVTGQGAAEELGVLEARRSPHFARAARLEIDVADLSIEAIVAAVRRSYSGR